MLIITHIGDILLNEIFSINLFAFKVDNENFLIQYRAIYFYIIIGMVYL